MKTSPFKFAVAAILMLVVKPPAYPQGTFMNLDFEHPILPFVVGGDSMVSITNAMPGWVGYIGGSPVTSVIYDTVSLGAAAISIQDTASSFQPIQGSYSAILQPSSGGPPTTAALGQTGQIPTTAMSLLFYGSPGMQVTFRGQPLSVVELGSFPTYSSFGAPISAFAGQTGELLFLMPNFSFPAMSYLDNVRFSDQQLPEPGIGSLCFLGALVLGWRALKQRR